MSSAHESWHDHKRRALSAANQLAATCVSPPPPETGEDRSPSSPRWLGQSLAAGAAGAVILHGVLAHAGLASWQPVHEWLARAAREDLSAGPGAGLWFGAPAIAFAMTHAAPPGHYQRVMATLDAAVVRMARTRLDAAHARIDAVVRPQLAEFDLVRGLTGLGVYLLRRAPQGDPVRQVLAYLVRLTEVLPADDEPGTGVPGWWSSDDPSGESGKDHFGGHANLGMAHGISGPLAFMALAMRENVIVEGQAAAIECICEWLDAWRQDDPAGPWWPERIRLAEHRTGEPVQKGPARPSWCYGTPGLARAQQLAALATHDRSRQLLAEHAMARCLADPAQLAHIIDPALCHGWAGLLATVWHTAADASSPDIAAHIPLVLDALLDQLGSAGSVSRRRHGLIEGDAGIALTLHTIASRTNTGWASCLLIT